MLFVNMNTSLLIRLKSQILATLSTQLTEYHFSSTPLEKMYRDGRIQNSCCQIIHHSDTLRLAILYRCEEISPTITVSVEHKKFNKTTLLEPNIKQLALI